MSKMKKYSHAVMYSVLYFLLYFNLTTEISVFHKHHLLFWVNKTPVWPSGDYICKVEFDLLYKYNWGLDKKKINKLFIFIFLPAGLVQYCFHLVDLISTKVDHGEMNPVIMLNAHLSEQQPKNRRINTSSPIMKQETATLTHNLLSHVLIFMQNIRTNGYLKLLMKCLNASVLFDRGTMMLMRMLRAFRLSLFTFTRGPKGLKSSSWVKTCGPSPLNISSYTVPLSRSVRVNPEDRIENVSKPDRCSLMWAYFNFLTTFSRAWHLLLQNLTL